MTTEISVSNSRGEIIPLSNGIFASLGLTDLRRLRFGGRPLAGQTFSGNFVECLFDNVDLENIDFSRCDWKDCQVNNTRFVNCNLSSASLITNSFNVCQFVGCKFSDTGISNCTFNNCLFEGCDLSNIVMKSNRVNSSSFESCATSNKIIESSLLLESRWINMNLEIGLLLENFGLKNSDFHKCTLFKKTATGEYSPLEWSKLTELASAANPSPIERFRLAFFRTGIADGDAQVFEDALNPENWSDEAIIESSFGDLLSNFTQFLLALYSDNQLPIYAILRLHSNNFKMLEWLASKPELLVLYQVAAGVHLTLTREVDGFVFLLQGLANTVGPKHVVAIEAEGPCNKEYFESFFAELGIKNILITSIRPRNSPLELLISALDNSALLSAIAVILASRTKIELIRLQKYVEPQPNSDVSEVNRSTHGQALIQFNSGFSELRPSEFQINIQTLLPRSLLIDLHLNISVGLFKKARTVLLGLLQQGHATKS